MARFGFVGRAISVGAVLGLSLLGVSSASAVTSSPLIDSSKNGSSSVTVVKFKQNATNGTKENTGEAIPPSGEPLQGVTFKVEKVTSINGTDISGLDYTKNATWKTLSGLVGSNGQPKGDVKVSPAAVGGGPKVTPASGKVQFTNLNFGVYRITETVTPKGVTPAVPFYMTLPFAQKTNPTVWNYDPTVYPKNTVNTFDKTVNDSKTTGIDSPIVYTLKSSLSLPEGQATSKYVVSDQLNKRVAFQSATVAFEKSKTALVKGTDYDLVPTAPGAGGEKVVVTFKGPGFAKLAAAYKANVTDHVVVTINAKLVKSSTADDNKGAISNTAHFVPDDSPKWENEGLPSTTVDSKFGRLKIVKVSAADNTTKLDGVKFKLFASESEAKAQTNPVKVVNAAGAVVDEVTTDSKGVATMAGIRLSDFQNGVAQSPARKYYLVETKAHEGYALLPAPVEVTLTDSNEFVTSINVENSKTNVGLILGHTGANGPVLFGVAGLLLLIGAAGLYYAKRRKASGTANESTE